MFYEAKKINSTKTCEVITLAILILSNIQNGYSDCLIGDVMYMEGESTGHIGIGCLDETSYDGLEIICGPDGQLIEVKKQFTCFSTVPNCVQCGERGRGAALCLSSTDDLQDDCKIITDEISMKPCVTEADCPIPDDPYCGYSCFDGTCAMWCQSEQQPFCMSGADCPVSSDPSCDYDCINGNCLEYCESSCSSEADCPVSSDPFCGYDCIDGFCALYCKGEGVVVEPECTPGVDQNCCATMIPPAYPPSDDSTCWQWWTAPANGILPRGASLPPKGCDYQPCQDAVCACDSYCCEAAWDLSCRGYENNYFVDGCSAKILCCEAL